MHKVTYSIAAILAAATMTTASWAANNNDNAGDMAANNQNQNWRQNQDQNQSWGQNQNDQQNGRYQNDNWQQQNNPQNQAQNGRRPSRFGNQANNEPEQNNGYRTNGYRQNQPFGRNQRYQNEFNGDQANAGRQGQWRKSTGQKAPTGFVILDRRVVYLTAQEPQNHLMQAAAQLARGNQNAAAAEVGIAANYIDMQSTQASGHEQDQLQDCAQKLQHLARQIRNGQVNSISDLHQSFSKANLTMAMYFQKQAKQDLNQNQNVRAGNDLQAAANSFADALIWNQQRPQHNDVRAVARARVLAAELINGENPSSNQQSSWSNQNGQSQSHQDWGQNGQQKNQSSSNSDRLQDESANGRNQNGRSNQFANLKPQDVTQTLGQRISQFQQQVASSTTGNTSGQQNDGQNQNQQNQGGVNASSTASEQY